MARHAHQSTTTPSDLRPQGQSLPQQIARLDAGRLRGYAELLAFYQGEQWPAATRRRERRLTFNYAKTFIEKTTSYLMSGMHAVVDPEDGSAEAAEQARRTERALQEVAEQNNLAQLDFDTEIDAAALGDGAFKVTWDPIERRVRVSAPDVQGLFVWWLGDDVSRIWRVASRYHLSMEEVELAFGFRPPEGRSGRDRRIDVVEVWTAETFELWVDGTLLEEKANTYGFIPFVFEPGDPAAASSSWRWVTRSMTSGVGSSEATTRCRRSPRGPAPA